MFASHEVIVPVGYEGASARLVHLVNWGALHGVSETVYEGGWEALVRVGPFGDLPGLSKLVRVRVLAPVRHDATVTVSLRWEATGPAGELFPVLDADLTLTPDGEGRSRLRLVGSYRPPLGRAGAAVDRAILNRVAVATVRSMLDNVADLLTDAAPYPHIGQDTAPHWRPAAEPGQP
jgi:hypothetical protein